MARPGAIHRTRVLGNRPERNQSASVLEHPTTGDFSHQDPFGAQPLLQLGDDVDEMLGGPGPKQSLGRLARTMDGGNDPHRLNARLAELISTELVNATRKVIELTRQPSQQIVTAELPRLTPGALRQSRGGSDENAGLGTYPAVGCQICHELLHHRTHHGHHLCAERFRIVKDDFHGVVVLGPVCRQHSGVHATCPIVGALTNLREPLDDMLTVQTGEGANSRQTELAQGPNQCLIGLSGTRQNRDVAGSQEVPGRPGTEDPRVMTLGAGHIGGSHLCCEQSVRHRNSRIRVPDPSQHLGHALRSGAFPTIKTSNSASSHRGHPWSHYVDRRRH